MTALDGWWNNWALDTHANMSRQSREDTMSTTPQVTTTEAARLFGVSSETVRRWADAQLIPHVRLPSGRLRFRRSDIDALLTPVESGTPTGEDAA